MSENSENEGKPRRRRGLTEVTLGWLADRLRKAESIKQQIESGTYKVNSDQVAASIVNEK